MRPLSHMRPLPTPLTLAWLALCAASCAQEPPAAGTYDLAHPTRSFDLPHELREISDLTWVGEHTLGCVQDEKGVLYLLDARDGRLRAAHPFGPKGDYEGLARIGAVFYVLRSDGMLLRLTARGSGFTIADAIALPTPQRNLEGLCFDPVRNVLLIAPKDVALPPPPPKDGDLDKAAERAAKQAREEAEDERVLWGFDPKARKLLDEPVLRLSIERIDMQAEGNPDLPTRSGKKGQQRPDLKLRFSCVAVHPQTHEIWMLSSADHLVLAFSRTGDLRLLRALDPKVLPKPEGMTFLPDGSLVLSTEADTGPARVFVYAPVKR